MHIAGTCYPIEKFYLGDALQLTGYSSLSIHNSADLARAVCALATDAWKSSDMCGHCLVFLPGTRMITEVAELAVQQGFQVVEVSGEIGASYIHKLGRQSRVFVLSTNVAEVSVTIPNVSIVVNSGLKKEY